MGVEVCIDLPPKITSHWESMPLAWILILTFSFICLLMNIMLTFKHAWRITGAAEEERKQSRKPL